MPVSLRWYNEQKTIIYQNYTGEWTLEDTYRIADETYAMMDTVDHPVHVIADFTGSLTVPARLLTSAHSMNNRIHPNRSSVVLVRAGLLLKTLIRTGMKIAPAALSVMQFVESLDDALRLLAVREPATI